MVFFPRHCMYLMPYISSQFSGFICMTYMKTSTNMHISKLGPSKLAFQIFTRIKSVVSPLFLSAASLNELNCAELRVFHNLCFIICGCKHHKEFLVTPLLFCVSKWNRGGQREGFPNSKQPAIAVFTLQLKQNLFRHLCKLKLSWVRTNKQV